MKKVIALSLIAALSLASPVFAEDDRIAQLEQQVADLTARVEALEGNKAAAPAAEAVTVPANEDSQVTGNVAISVVGVSQAEEVENILTRVPEEGKVFIVLSLDFTNVGTEVESISEFSNHTDSYADGYTVKLNTDASDLSGDILPGRHVAGTVAYEVPIGWSTFEFCWQQGHKPDEGIASFVYTPADLS